MKYIGNYKEFNSNYDFPSMRESFSGTQYDNQERIARYLERGKPGMAVASAAIDVFTGKKFATGYCSYSDGEYCWFSYLPYYIRKYNLRLPAEIETYILSK